MSEILTKTDPERREELLDQLRRHKEYQTNFDLSKSKWVKADSKIGKRINKIAKNNGLENTSATTIFNHSINESEHLEELSRYIKINKPTENEIELAYDCIFLNCEKIIKQMHRKKELNQQKRELLNQLKIHKELKTNFNFKHQLNWVKADSKIGKRINKIAKNNGLENTSATTIFNHSINESEHLEELSRYIKINKPTENEIELAYDCIFLNCEKIIKKIDEKKEDAETKERKELRIKKQNNELLEKLNKLDEFKGELNLNPGEKTVLNKSGLISRTLTGYINKKYRKKHNLDLSNEFVAPDLLFGEVLLKRRSVIEKELLDEPSVSIRSIIFNTAGQILTDKIRQKNRSQMTLKNKHLRSLKPYADKTDKWYAGGHKHDPTIRWDKSIQDFIMISKYDDTKVTIFKVQYSTTQAPNKFIDYPKDQKEANKDPKFQGLAEGCKLKWQTIIEKIEHQGATQIDDYHHDCISEMDIQHAKDKLVKELIKRDSICKRYVDVIQNLLLKFGLEKKVTAQKYRSLSTSIMNEKDQKKCLEILNELRKNDEIRSLIFDAYNQEF